MRAFVQATEGRIRLDGVECTLWNGLTRDEKPIPFWMFCADIFVPEPKDDFIGEMADKPGCEMTVGKDANGLLAFIVTTPTGIKFEIFVHILGSNPNDSQRLLQNIDGLQSVDGPDYAHVLEKK